MRMTELNTRQRRLISYYNHKNAPLFGPTDYTLIYPTPDGIVLSDENETIASVLCGDLFDRKLRSFVIISWFPGLVCQLACFPIGFMTFIGSIDSSMTLLTIPGALFPILLLLRSHWRVTVILMRRWESIFLTVYSFIFCVCCTLLLEADFRCVFIWAVIFPALLASTFTDASAVRLDSAFLRGSLSVAALTVPPYIIALAYVFSIIGLINTRRFVYFGGAVNLHLSSTIVQSNVNYAYIASSTGITISLFLVKSLVVFFFNPSHCISLDAAMVIDIVTLDKIIERKGSPKNGLFADDVQSHTPGGLNGKILKTNKVGIGINKGSDACPSGSTSSKSMKFDPKNFTYGSDNSRGISVGKVFHLSEGNNNEQVHVEDNSEIIDKKEIYSGMSGREKVLRDKIEEEKNYGNERMILEAAFHLKGAIGLIPIRRGTSQKSLFSNLFFGGTVFSSSRAPRLSFSRFFRRSDRIDISSAAAEHDPHNFISADSGRPIQRNIDSCSYDMKSVVAKVTDMDGLVISSTRLNLDGGGTSVQQNILPFARAVSLKVGKQSVYSSDTNHSCRGVDLNTIPVPKLSEWSPDIGKKSGNVVVIKAVTSRIDFRESSFRLSAKSKGRGLLRESFNDSRIPIPIHQEINPTRNFKIYKSFSCRKSSDCPDHVFEERAHGLESDEIPPSFNLLSVDNYDSHPCVIGGSNGRTASSLCSTGAHDGNIASHQILEVTEFRSEAYDNFDNERNDINDNKRVKNAQSCSSDDRNFIVTQWDRPYMGLQGPCSSNNYHGDTRISSDISDNGNIKRSDSDDANESRDPSIPSPRSAPAAIVPSLLPSNGLASGPSPSPFPILSDRQLRLSPFYSKANATLFGPDDYTLLSPVPSSILISDECETVALVLFGEYFDTKLRGFVKWYWYPAFLLQLSCLPVGLLIILGSLPTRGVFFTVPGAIFPIIVLLRCHWKVFTALLYNWEQLFLTMYSFLFCLCISLMTRRLTRTIYIWVVLFPSLISSIFSDASSTRLDYLFLNKMQKKAMLRYVIMHSLLPYIASLAYIFSIVALLNLNFQVLLDTFASFQIDIVVLRTNVNYSVTASNAGLTISLFLIKCLYHLITEPSRCVTLRSPMTVNIAVLEPLPTDAAERAQGHYILEARFAIQRGGVVVEHSEGQGRRSDMEKGKEEGEGEGDCKSYGKRSNSKFGGTKRIYFRGTREVQERQRYNYNHNDNHNDNGGQECREYEILRDPETAAGKISREENAREIV